jgi:hypothetical protein
MVGYIQPSAAVKGSWEAFVYLYLPANLPAKTWNLEARSGTLLLKDSLSTQWPSTKPAIFGPVLKFDPFNPLPFYTVVRAGYPVYALKLTDSLAVKGINLSPNQTMTLGMYNRQTGNLQRSLAVYTDAKGSFELTFKPLSSDPTGAYKLVAFNNQDQVGSVDLAITEFSACANAPISHSYFGRLVHDNPAIILPNNVRKEPGKSSTLVGKLQLGMGAVILDGPRCADNMVWWKISFPIYPDSNSIVTTGWTAEGQGSEIWLVDYVPK